MEFQNYLNCVQFKFIHITDKPVDIKYETTITMKEIEKNYNVTIDNFCAMIQYCIENKTYKLEENEDKTMFAIFHYDNITTENLSILLKPIVPLTPIEECESQIEDLEIEIKELKNHIKSMPTIIGTINNKPIFFHGPSLQVSSKCNFEIDEVVFCKTIYTHCTTILPSLQYANCTSIIYENDYSGGDVYKYMPKNVNTVTLQGYICLTHFIDYHNPENVNNITKIILFLTATNMDLSGLNKFNNIILELHGNKHVDCTMLNDSIKIEKIEK
jgi:hypothetical protein